MVKPDPLISERAGKTGAKQGVGNICWFPSLERPAGKSNAMSSNKSMAIQTTGYELIII